MYVGHVQGLRIELIDFTSLVFPTRDPLRRIESAVSFTPQSRRGGLMDFRLRMALWIPSLAYAFLLLGGKNFALLDQDVFLAFQGAVLGFLAAAMFSIRQHRRERLFAREPRSTPLS